VRGRRRFLFPVASLLGAAVAALPAVAASEAGPIEAVDSSGYYGEQRHSWSPREAAVSAGGVVTFLNSSSTVKHGVVWSAGDPETPNCTGLPVNEGKTSWQGSCTFSKPGVYAFYCYVHGPSMSGTITVNPTGTTTTTTTPTGTTTVTPPGGTMSTPAGGSVPGGSPSAGPAVGVVSLSATQRGRTVRGSLEVPVADAGGRLEVDLLSKRASLARSGGAAIRVGRLLRSSLRAGRLSFSVPLNARARVALVRHRRLQLTVKIVLTPSQGSPSSTTRSIVLHP
jgi:plastocyanin